MNAKVLALAVLVLSLAIVNTSFLAQPAPPSNCSSAFETWSDWPGFHAGTSACDTWAIQSGFTQGYTSTGKRAFTVGQTVSSAVRVGGSVGDTLLASYQFPVNDMAIGFLEVTSGFSQKTRRYGWRIYADDGVSGLKDITEYNGVLSRPYDVTMTAGAFAGKKAYSPATLTNDRIQFDLRTATTATGYLIIEIHLEGDGGLLSTGMGMWITSLEYWGGALYPPVNVKTTPGNSEYTVCWEQYEPRDPRIHHTAVYDNTGLVGTISPLQLVNRTNGTPYSVEVKNFSDEAETHEAVTATSVSPSFGTGQFSETLLQMDLLHGWWVRQTFERVSGQGNLYATGYEVWRKRPGESWIIFTTLGSTEIEFHDFEIPTMGGDFWLYKIISFYEVTPGNTIYEPGRP